MQSQKWQNDLCFQCKPCNITVIQVYDLTSNAKEAEVEWFYEDLQDLIEPTPKKRCPFHYRGLECVSRKSRDTWSNRQTWFWNTKWNRAKANRLLPREHIGHSKYPFQQHKRPHYTLTSPDGQYLNQNDCILCSQKWRSSIQSAKTRPRAECGSDQKLLVVKFRLKWRK